MRRLLGILAAGCVAQRTEFVCRMDGDCVRPGEAGACEDTGFCSFPDPRCVDSGRRYGAYAGDGLAGACTRPAWHLLEASGPPARHSAPLVYDDLRDRMVLVGGRGPDPILDVWEWDGATWTGAGALPAALSVSGIQMAFDESRHVSVLYDPFGLRSWEWDGTSFTAQTLPSGLTPRQGAAMAYDVRRRVTVLFGGWDGTANLDETWELDGQAWVLRSLPGRPPGRAAAAAAYDAERGVIVLFGGGSGDGSMLDDTWEYDGTTWAARDPASGPARRRAHRLAWDPGRRLVLLFGGWDEQMTFADLWGWDGTTWRELPSATAAPPGRRSAGMAFDTLRGHLLVFGGAGALEVQPGGLDDLWSY